MIIPLAKSAFVFENGNFNHGSDFAKASSFAKATADKTTDRWHGWARIMKELWKRFSNLFGVFLNP